MFTITPRRSAVGSWPQDRNFLLPPRWKEPGFWLVQALILAATLAHVITEIAGLSDNLADLRHIPVTLYVVPIVVAALLYGFQGALLATVQSLIIALPSISFWHHSGWSAELSAIFAVAFVSNLLSWRIERESRLRRAAEQLAHQLTIAEAHIRDYATALTETQERERHHLARELHDSSLQDVLLLVRNLEELDRTINGDASQSHEAVARLIDLSRSVARDLRRYSQSLRPPVLDDLGLVPAIEALADEVTEQTGIESRVTLQGELAPLKQEVSLAVFRIVQEALRNVEKHSHAKNVEVGISCDQDLVAICVQDDGVGFDVKSVSSAVNGTTSMGLLGMKERATLIEGKLGMESSPGSGAKMRLVFPAKSMGVQSVG